jgi:hypothetical protein
MRGATSIIAAFLEGIVMAVTAVKHVSAVLKLPRRVKDIGGFATSIVTAVAGNATIFANPSPPLATIEADIAGLNTSESAVLSRVKGAAQERNVKLATVKADLDHLMAYVQATADASPASAESIIEAAGMSTRKLVTHPKNDIKVEQGAVSGSAALIAKAVATRASYEWQYSTDQKTWLNAPTTLQAKTDIVGLTAGTAYFFRVRGVTKAGEQNWSQVVSLLMT